MHVKQRKGGALPPSPLCCKHSLFSAGGTGPTRSSLAPGTLKQNFFKDAQLAYVGQSASPYLVTVGEDRSWNGG